MPICGKRCGSGVIFGLGHTLREDDLRGGLRWPTAQDHDRRRVGIRRNPRDPRSDRLQPGCRLEAPGVSTVYLPPVGDAASTVPGRALLRLQRW